MTRSPHFRLAYVVAAIAVAFLAVATLAASALFSDRNSDGSTGADPTHPALSSAAKGVSNGTDISAPNPDGGTPYLFTYRNPELPSGEITVNVTVLAVLVAVVYAGGIIAFTAWVLRPVKVIQRELEEITEHDLSRRVPVPRRQRDITELANTVNATLDRLETAAENNRRFVADASHELRTPLAALRAELEIAISHPGHIDPGLVIRNALGDTERLQQLTADLLLLSRLDGATTEFEDQVDLTELVHSESLARRLPDHLTLDLQLPEKPVLISGSRPLLARLLGNLLDNAQRYARTTITVTLKSDATLEVLDDGPGIPLEHHDRVFRRFTRIDDARNRDTGGAGLGLAIAHRIAANHRGAVRLAHGNKAHFIVNFTWV
jgi:signal transduction histidine kinase